MIINDTIRDALTLLGVIAVGETPTAEDTSLALGVLDAMMHRWEANGIALGWSTPASVYDEIHAPKSAMQAIGSNLAVLLRPRYGLPMLPDVVEMAERGLAELRRDVRIAHPIETETVGTRYDIRTDNYL